MFNNGRKIHYLYLKLQKPMKSIYYMKAIGFAVCSSQHVVLLFCCSLTSSVATKQFGIAT